MKWAAMAGGGFVAFVLAIVLGVAIGGSAANCGGGGGQIDDSRIPATASVAGWDAEQLVNAAHIMNAAAGLGLGTRAQQLGVMTAMGESSLRNIRHGDGAINPDGSVADSIGLFQQQSSWGSTADRMNPAVAARLFFERLQKVSGWETMPPSMAAHLVQLNADPDHYTDSWDAAVQVTDELARAYGSEDPILCTAGDAALPLDAPYMMTDRFGPRVAPTAGVLPFHRGIDLVGGCGDPVYAVLEGRVVISDSLTLGIQSPDGFTVQYLHSAVVDRTVKVGDQVARGQIITLVGNEGPSTGCHLDLRVNIVDNENPVVAALPTSPEAGGWVDPELFFAAFGVDVCPAEWCGRAY